MWSPTVCLHSLCACEATLSSDRNLDLHTSLDVDNDLLDDLSGGIQTILVLAKNLQLVFCINILNQTLVNSHLESIPGLGSFTARSLPGSDLEVAGWETDGTLNTEILGLGTLDEFLTDLLKRLNFSAGQGNSDLVGFLRTSPSVYIRSRMHRPRKNETYWALAEFLVGVLLVRHCVDDVPSRLDLKSNMDLKYGKVVRMIIDGGICACACRWRNVWRISFLGLWVEVLASAIPH